MTSLVLDCRWLAHAGVGRATEYLVRGLRQGERRAHWTLWGPRAAAELAPDFEWVVDERDPRRWAGQHANLVRPRGRWATVYMHQTRPLLGGRCVTVIHDTIQLRTARSPAVAAARRAFLRLVAASSAGIITVSDWSRDRIAEDLGVAPDRIRVVGNPASAEFGERIRRLRRQLPRREMALYVGLFSPHKNIDGLIAGFAETGLRRRGGELVLVGGREKEARLLRERVADSQVRIMTRCPQDQLDRLFAETLILVQPSFEEGFGLPVWEAMAAGISVACSRGGALSTVGAGATATFDPHSVPDMTRAIDAAADVARAQTVEDEDAAAARFLEGTPTPRQYADTMEDAVLRFTEPAP